MTYHALALALLAVAAVDAASSPTASKCAHQLQPSSGIKPSVASGYIYAVVATGLTSPRSLQFDENGDLWVLEQNKGLSKHTLQDDGGTCVGIKSSTDVISDANLNHGLIVDGKDIYVSSNEMVYMVGLDDSGSKIAANSNKTLVTGMKGSDHTTRTLLKVKNAESADNAIMVSRGSFENTDLEAGSKSSGHSSVKMFDIGNMKGDAYDYAKDGSVLGWGLRNSVGLVQHPTTGGVFAVENSVDQLDRDGTDVHQDNPAEEMNFLGFIDGNKTSNLGQNFGYPYCYSAWKPKDMPANGQLKVGSVFSPKSSNDSACGKTVGPRLSFQAHMAPLDIKFNNSAKEAWISFHGSWNRDTPAGYYVGYVDFKDCGMPVAPPDSDNATHVVLGNEDNGQCPQNCLRPSGLAFDKQGRLFATSDSSGEIYVIMKEPSSNGSSGGNDSGTDGTPTVSGWTIGVLTAICLLAALI